MVALPIDGCACCTPEFSSMAPYSGALPASPASCCQACYRVAILQACTQPPNYTVDLQPVTAARVTASVHQPSPGSPVRFSSTTSCIDAHPLRVCLSPSTASKQDELPS